MRLAIATLVAALAAGCSDGGSSSGGPTCKGLFSVWVSKSSVLDLRGFDYGLNGPFELPGQCTYWISIDSDSMDVVNSSGPSICGGTWAYSLSCDSLVFDGEEYR